MTQEATAVEGPSPGQLEQMQQQLATEQLFNQPVALPIRYAVGSAQAQDGTALVTFFAETPAGAIKLTMSREFALEMATNLKKQANTGPMLVSPPPGFTVPRT